MAGDWIKMRVNLHDDTDVVSIAKDVRARNLRADCSMCAQKCAVVGALHLVWSLFDAHTEDGVLRAYTLEMIDEKVGLPGFAEAMQSVGWLAVVDNSLAMPDFDEWLGKSAKRRLAARKRAKKSYEKRKSAQTLRADCAPKRRGEKSTKDPHSPPEGDGDAKKHPRVIPAYTEAFNAFWNRYPTANRVNKKGAFKVWCKQHVERDAVPGKPRMLDCVMAGLDKWCQCERWKAGFVCAPTVFLNQARWSNDPPHSERQS